MDNALITQTDRSKVEFVDFRPTRRRWLPKAVVLLVVLFIVGLVRASPVNEYAASSFQHIDLRHCLNGPLDSRVNTLQICQQLWERHPAAIGTTEISDANRGRMPLPLTDCVFKQSS